MSAATTTSSTTLDFERQRRYNMDILLAAAEALRRAEVNECYSRAGKVSSMCIVFVLLCMPSRIASSIRKILTCM